MLVVLMEVLAGIRSVFPFDKIRLCLFSLCTNASVGIPCVFGDFDRLIFLSPVNSKDEIAL